MYIEIQVWVKLKLTLICLSIKNSTINVLNFEHFIPHFFSLFFFLFMQLFIKKLSGMVNSGNPD